MAKRTALREAMTVAAMCLLAITAQAQTSATTDEIDKALAAAVEKAQATLSQFWPVAEKPGPKDENFRIRIRYATPSGGSEDLWAVDMRREAAGNVAATIDGAPRDVPGIAHGQRVTVPEAWVVDWFYFRDGRMHGAYSIRALLPTMTRREAEKYRALLAPD